MPRSYRFPAYILLVLGALHARPNVVAAQEASPRTDSILARAERGDSGARSKAEALGWTYIKLAAEEGRLDPATARRMARAALIVEGPLAPLDAPPTPQDRIWRSAAVSALEMALGADSGDLWSATQLDRIAPYPFIWENPDKELIALRALQVRHPNLPSALRMTEVRLELERGSADSAAVRFTELPANAASAAALGHLAAEIAFANRLDSAGTAAYYRGAAAIGDSADAAWYTRDIAWIAEGSELTEWNALPPAGRGAWLKRFWNRRDFGDGQLPGTRLPEQFRRWRVALRDYRWEYDGSTAKGMVIPFNDGVEYHYLLINGKIAGGDDSFPRDPTVSELDYLNRMRPLSKVIDDRGGLILRHGDPAQRVTMPGITQLQEETLMWRTPSGPLIVSFSRMAERIPPPLGTLVPSQRYGMVARNYPAGDLMANCEVDPKLCTLAAQVGEGASKALILTSGNTVHQDFKRMRTEAERTDGNPESFATDLGATFQAYGIPGGGTLVVFDIPAKPLATAIHDTAAMSLSARLRIVVGDSARGEFAGTLDTVRTWTLGATPSAQATVAGFVVLRAPPGSWSVAMVMSDIARHAGTGGRIDGVPVVDFGDSALELGDPILGSDASGLVWNHDGGSIPLNPRNVWRPDEPATLSYEVGGLVPGRSYDTRIEIWEAAGRPGTYRNSIQFALPASATIMAIQRDLALDQLGEGSYRVVVRVRDTVTGREVSRERHLLIRR
jgi:hypothetical protein